MHLIHDFGLSHLNRLNVVHRFFVSDFNLLECTMEGIVYFEKYMGNKHCPVLQWFWIQHGTEDVASVHGRYSETTDK